MIPLKITFATLALALTAACWTTSTSAQGSAPSPSEAKPAADAQPNEADMMAQMMELAKTNENHKLLVSLNGNWDYKVKFWMAPGAPPNEAGGTAVRKDIMDGRYSVMHVKGKMSMPGADGKMKEMDFEGMSVDGYDNVKKKFVSTWTDNMGTGILMSEGTYDPATHTFTYGWEMEMMLGMKSKGRQVIKLVDKNHQLFEWYEDHGGQEVKTMEIAYTRKS